MFFLNFCHVTQVHFQLSSVKSDLPARQFCNLHVKINFRHLDYGKQQRLIIFHSVRLFSPILNNMNYALLITICYPNKCFCRPAVVAWWYRIFICNGPAINVVDCDMYLYFTQNPTTTKLHIYSPTPVLVYYRVSG